LTWEAALKEIQEHSGTQFDPQVVKTALRALPRLEQIYMEENHQD